jgi:hypothetical protein
MANPQGIKELYHHLDDEKMLGAWLGFRENIAAQLLFGDCLKKFENNSRRSALVTMFGSNLTIKPNTTTKSSIKTPKIQKQITQTPISNYLLDTFLVSTIRKNERASSIAAKKKIKELAMVKNLHFPLL